MNILNTLWQVLFCLYTSCRFYVILCHTVVALHII